MPINEADTCRTYVVPKLYSAGWEDTPISEQNSLTDGRIMLVGNQAIRRPQKRADYLLRYRRDFPIAVVGAIPATPAALAYGWSICHTTFSESVAPCT